MPVAAEHADGGPFYFAWVDASEATFSVGHERYDEYIFSFERKLEEGKIPTLTVEMSNPGALLAPGRKQWAWLAKDNGTDVEPLFFGRIVAIPTDILAQVVTVQFIAKPLDYLEQKQDIAAGLRVAPYDPVFVDPAYRDDPNSVLECRSALWHHDPVTHEVSVSDILTGEDGVEELLSFDTFHDSLQLTIGQAPLKAVTVEATVGWTQEADGSLTINTPTFADESMVGAWPKAGTSVGAGWEVESSSAVDANRVADVQSATYTFEFKDQSKTHSNGDLLTHDHSVTKPEFYGAFKRKVTAVSSSNNVGDPESGQAASTSVQTTYAYIGISAVHTELTLKYEAERERTETLRFTLSADYQAIVTDTEDTEDVEVVTLSGADVGVDVGGGAPIGSLARRSYFPTTRGQRSIEYAVMVARAHLLARSRAVSVTVDCPFDRAILLTCRKNALIPDDRLPGGEAYGKITTALLKADGDSGTYIGTVTIGCSVGFGGAFAEVEGTPDYVEADCLGPDTQFYIGRIVALSSGDVGYTVPIDAVNDDGLVFPLTTAQAVVRNQVVSTGDVTTIPGPSIGLINSVDQFSTAWKAQRASVDAVAAAVKTVYELELKPLTGSFNVEYDLTVGPLIVPQMVDLEAA